MKKVALLIDGGYLRPVSRKAGYEYNPDLIERISHQCIEKDKEELFRVLYYDCAPFVGQVRKPVSGKPTTFEGSDEWLRDLANRDFFAVSQQGFLCG